MVERKIRPAPLSLVARKSARTSGKPGPAPRLLPPSKLFVLDTNVLMHDPTSLFRFEQGSWKLVHRHADTITEPRPAASVINK